MVLFVLLTKWLNEMELNKKPEKYYEKKRSITK